MGSALTVSVRCAYGLIKKYAHFMPTYAAIKLVDATRIYASIARAFSGSIAHIHVHPDQLICTCIERFQVSGVECQDRKKLKPETLK
jgi:hypothetical protein